MSVEVTSVFIGAVTATVMTFISNYCLSYLKRKSLQKEKIKSLTERYAHPLGMSAVGLFYRLNEIIVFKRCDFLQKTTHVNDYNKYKYISSIYRLVSLIGWVRALELESSHLIQSGNQQSGQIVELVSDFKKALADGPHVEIEIIKQLADLWHIKLPSSNHEIIMIAGKCDQARNYTFNNESMAIKDDDLVASIQKVAQALCSSNLSEQIPIKIISETANQAKHILTPKQAWIYRDWINAIGDIMLTKSFSPARDFDVIGYAAFEELYNANNPWVNRAEKVFSDVNFEIKQHDYRPDQLLSILCATAKLIIEINKLDIDSKPFTKCNIDDVSSYLDQYT